MRFLILAYSYPPATNPRALRFGALAEYWAERGHQIDVVCGWKPGWPQQEVRNGVCVQRVGGNLSERLRAGMRPTSIHSSGTSAQATSCSRERLLTRIGRRFKKLARAGHDLTWKKLYWPDSNCLWYLPALKAARVLLSAHKYDAVISVSIPFTSHLVAYRLRKQMQGAKWLVDSGDPFSFLDECRPNNSWLYRKFNFAWEQKIFRAASAISVTSDQTARKYHEYFPDCSVKIHVIPPLATNSMADSCDLKLAAHSNRPIRLVYAGTMYRKIRNPTFLFKLFAALLQSPLGNRLELHLYGLSHDCSDLVEEHRQKFGKHLHVHGLVSAQTARRGMARAEILVNLGNSTDYQLPSKLVDYAATGKPILNLISIAQDSSARFLKSHPCTLTVRECGSGAEKEQATSVLEFIKSPPRMDWVQLRAWMQPYEIDQVAARYTELIAGQDTTRLQRAYLRDAA